MRGLALGFFILVVPAAALAQGSPQPASSERPYTTRIILNGDDVRRLLQSPAPSPSGSVRPSARPTTRRKLTVKPRTPQPADTVPPPDVFSDHKN